MPIKGRELPEKAVDVGTAFSVSNTTQANATLNLADSYLATVSTARESFGASEAQLNSVVNNLSNSVTNLTQAKSQISDTDFSVETTALAKAQILAQASTAMLAQANPDRSGGSQTPAAVGALRLLSCIFRMRY